MNPENPSYAVNKTECYFHFHVFYTCLLFIFCSCVFVVMTGICNIFVSFNVALSLFTFIFTCFSHIYIKHF